MSEHTPLWVLFARLDDPSKYHRAAEELVKSYSPVMVPVIRLNLSRRLRRLVDPEDIAQDVWATFFYRRRWRRIPTTHEALGNLLCFMARLAALTAGQFHGACKRALSRDVPLDDVPVPQQAALLDHHAGPAEQASASDLREAVFRDATERARSVLQMVLDLRTREEIARTLAISLATVWRIVAEVRLRLAGQTS
jgi:DNA-directed RNA polymerase specialized sigma24 family protein